MRAVPQVLVARVTQAKMLLDLRSGLRHPRSHVLERAYFQQAEEAATRKRLRQEWAALSLQYSDF